MPFLVEKCFPRKLKSLKSCITQSSLVIYLDHGAVGENIFPMKLCYSCTTDENYRTLYFIY